MPGPLYPSSDFKLVFGLLVAALAAAYFFVKDSDWFRGLGPWLPGGAMPDTDDDLG